MKHNIILFIICLFAFSCSNNTQKQTEGEQEKAEETRTIVDPQNRQDTVYFGYVLGQSTKGITQKLLKNGELSSTNMERRKYTLSYGGFSQDIIAEGYPFDLYIADKKYDALLTLYDTNGDLIEDDGKLMSLRICISGTDSGPIIDALKAQYGKTNTPPEDGYTLGAPEVVDAFWNISNKAVYLESYSSFMVLTYEDIIAIRERNNAESAKIESEKEHNLEQSKKTQL